MDFTATQYCKKSTGLWQVLCYPSPNCSKWKYFRSPFLGSVAPLCLWRPSFGPRHGGPLEQECSLQWDCLQSFLYFMAFDYMVYRIWIVRLVFPGWFCKVVSIFWVLRSTLYVLSPSVGSWRCSLYFVIRHVCQKDSVPEPLMFGVTRIRYFMSWLSWQ